jgi:hypothetical protein
MYLCCHAAQGAKVNVALAGFLFTMQINLNGKLQKNIFFLLSSFLLISSILLIKKESRHNFEPATPSTLSQTGRVLQIFSPPQH